MLGLKKPQNLEQKHTYVPLSYITVRLYGGTASNGKLYEWNGIDAWVEKASKLGVETNIRSLAVYNGKLYSGTAPNGKLYEWNSVDAWIEKAPRLGVEDGIFSLVVYNGKLYGGSNPNAKLLEWKTGVSASYDYELTSGLHHLVAAKDNTALKLYIDGALAATSSAFTPSDYNLTTINNLLIGFGQQDYFNGSLDEVRLLSRALSAEEITTQYNNENTPSTFYTLAGEESSTSLPSITVNNPTSTTLDINPNPNSNPASTEFAIYKEQGSSCDGSGGSYIAANGSDNGAIAVWQTDAKWATTGVINLSKNTRYSFCVKARNTTGTETAFGAASSGTTFDFSLDAPGDNSYTNSERPSFRWKAPTTGDTASSPSKYKLEVDNGDSGDFTVDDIPTSRTTDYETDKYTIHYDNFNDSDNTNNYISVYTKSSSLWGSDNNDGKLKEGKRSWKVIAYDNAGNTREESWNLLVDRSSPHTQLNQLNTIRLTNGNNTLKTTSTPTIYGKITDSLAGDSTSTSEQIKQENRIASGPKSIEVKIEKLNIFGLYDLHSLSTINLNETYLIGNGDKYSTFAFTPTKKLSLGNYKITFTGKDNAGNSGGSTIIKLNQTTLTQAITNYATTNYDKKIIYKTTQIKTSNPTPTAKPLNTLTPKTRAPIQKPIKAQTKFCILWWCF